MSNHPKRRLTVTRFRPNLKVSHRLRYTRSFQNRLPAPESPPHIGVPNRTLPAPLSAAAPPSNSGRGFQRRALPRPSSPWEGFPKGKAPKHRRGRIKRGAFEEMARLAAHQGRESYSHDGVRAEARPFVPRGGMGDGWRPPCFGWGSKGEGPLRQRPLPLALTWECPLA